VPYENMDNMVDGDKSLVCADNTIIQAAKRNIKNNNIVPLYYDMKKAKPTTIDYKTIYNGLQAAYKGGNIGMISNNITKILNSTEGDISEKLQVVKLLCLENNFTIDFAKTLYKPTRPEEEDKLIKKYTKKKPPHFFIYAKDKKEENVEPISNSTMDRLTQFIPNPNISFKKLNLNKFNYKNLLHNKKININENIIKKYKELDLKKPFMINKNNTNDGVGNIYYLYQDIKKQLIEVGKKELTLINNVTDSRLLQDIKNVEAERYVTDVLIKYLYSIKNTQFKTTLWSCFGEIIYMNLKHNLKGTKLCAKCKKRITYKSPKQKYCTRCAKEIKLEQTRGIARESMRKLRQKRKC